MELDSLPPFDKSEMLFGDMCNLVSEISDIFCNILNIISKDFLTGTVSE
jgi:hypothetical protein